MGNSITKIYNGPYWDKRPLTGDELKKWKKRYQTKKSIEAYQRKMVSIGKDAKTRFVHLRKTQVNLQMAAGDPDKLRALYGKAFGYRWVKPKPNKEDELEYMDFDDKPSLGCRLQYWSETTNKFIDALEIVQDDKLPNSGWCLKALTRFSGGSIITFFVGREVWKAKKPGTGWKEVEYLNNMDEEEADIKYNKEYTTAVRDHAGFARLLDASNPEVELKDGEGKGAATYLNLGAHFINDHVLSHTSQKLEDREDYQSVHDAKKLNYAVIEADGTVRSVHNMEKDTLIYGAYYPPHIGYFKGTNKYLPGNYHYIPESDYLKFVTDPKKRKARTTPFAAEDVADESGSDSNVGVGGGNNGGGEEEGGDGGRSAAIPFQQKRRQRGSGTRQSYIEEVHSSVTPIVHEVESSRYQEEKKDEMPSASAALSDSGDDDNQGGDDEEGDGWEDIEDPNDFFSGYQLLAQLRAYTSSPDEFQWYIDDHIRPTSRSLFPGLRTWIVLRRSRRITLNASQKLQLSEIDFSLEPNKKVRQPHTATGANDSADPSTNGDSGSSSPEKPGDTPDNGGLQPVVSSESSSPERVESNAPTSNQDASSTLALDDMVSKKVPVPLGCSAGDSFFATILIDGKLYVKPCELKNDYTNQSFVDPPKIEEGTIECVHGSSRAQTLVLSHPVTEGLKPMTKITWKINLSNQHRHPIHSMVVRFEQLEGKPSCVYYDTDIFMKYDDSATLVYTTVEEPSPEDNP